MHINPHIDWMFMREHFWVPLHYSSSVPPYGTSLISSTAVPPCHGAYVASLKIVAKMAVERPAAAVIETVLMAVVVTGIVRMAVAIAQAMAGVTWAATVKEAASKEAAAATGGAGRGPRAPAARPSATDPGRRARSHDASRLASGDGAVPGRHQQV